MRALKGDPTGPNPMDQGKYGSKIHLITEQTGLPFPFSGTDLHDSQALISLVKGIPSIRSHRGPRRRKPGKGYDYHRHVFRGPARGLLTSGPGMTVAPCRTDDLGGGVTGPEGCTAARHGFVHRFRRRLFSASGGTRAAACSMFTRSDSTRARR